MRTVNIQTKLGNNDINIKDLSIKELRELIQILDKTYYNLLENLNKDEKQIN